MATDQKDPEEQLRQKLEDVRGPDAAAKVTPHQKLFDLKKTLHVFHTIMDKYYTVARRQGVDAAIQACKKLKEPAGKVFRQVAERTPKAEVWGALAAAASGLARTVCKLTRNVPRKMVYKMPHERVAADVYGQGGAAQFAAMINCVKFAFMTAKDHTAAAWAEVEQELNPHFDIALAEIRAADALRMEAAPEAILWEAKAAVMRNFYTKPGSDWEVCDETCAERIIALYHEEEVNSDFHAIVKTRDGKWWSKQGEEPWVAEVDPTPMLGTYKRICFLKRKDNGKALLHTLQFWDGDDRRVSGAAGYDSEDSDDRHERARRVQEEYLAFLHEDNDRLRRERRTLRARARRVQALIHDLRG